MDWSYAWLLVVFGVPWMWEQFTEKPWRKEVVSDDTCHCGHSAVFHDAAGCRKMVTRPIKWDDYGDECKWTEGECECLHYANPNSAYVPELDGLPERKELD